MTLMSCVKRAGALVVKRVTSHALLLRQTERLCWSIGAHLRLASASVFAPIQVATEFEALLQFLCERRPRRILEIGTAKGGTLYLFSKVASDDATVVSVDLELQNERLLGSFARKQQRITLIEGDSTDPRVKQKIGEIFSDGVDVLFIDGDHSYHGVKGDFEEYSPLVRQGGVIVLHDIVESHDARRGVATGGWTGGVPRFWSEVKQQSEHLEFVESWDQDGFGIGVLSR